MSDYYQGLDKILAQAHKWRVDMTNTMNFIKKGDFISSGSFINKIKNYNDLKYFISPEENNHDKILIIIVIIIL